MVTLDGGGQISLDSRTDQLDQVIAAAPTGGTLHLFDRSVGSGTIGQGDGALTLVNEAGATIEAAVLTTNGAFTTGLLTIDTGHQIVNLGTLRAGAGATLQIDDSVDNTASGAIIQVDDNATLKLDGATITGGTINDGTADGAVIGDHSVYGKIDVTGDSAISGASLNNGGVTVATGTTLTLDNDVIDGTAISDNGGIAVVHTVTLQDGASVTGGDMTIGSAAKLEIENGAGSGATLDHVAVNNASGIIQVDGGNIGGPAPPVTLILADGATVTGGHLYVGMGGGAGVLEIEQGLNGSGATLNDVVVDNTYGTIQIDPSGGPGPGTPVTLVLADGTTVTGGQIDVGTAGGDGGVLEIEQGLNGSGATLDGVSVDNTNGTVQVDANATLALDNVPTVTGGHFNIVDATASVTVAGDTTISSAIDDGGTIEVLQGGALHLTNSIAGAGSIELAAGSAESISRCSN